MVQDAPATTRLRPYVSSLALEWDPVDPLPAARTLDGTLAFADISGFTRLTELLSANGKAGAEELTDLLNRTFVELLAIAHGHGAELVKWGGDAVLLLFTGDQHAVRAVGAARRMQRAMGTLGRLHTSLGRCQLRMSVGIHTGTFEFFVVGERHRELVLTGDAASMTARLEGTAEAGEVLVGPATAMRLPAAAVGASKGDGRLVVGTPPRPEFAVRASPSAANPVRYLPHALATHLAAGPVDSEHRQVAVAFIEFSGVGGLFASGGRSAVAAALHDLVTLVQQRCEHYHVTFWETDIGDDGGKIMLVGGAPTGGDDDTGRLLCVVREVIDAPTPLRLRAGVNAGRVFAGDFGPAHRRTYSVKGDAVNLAARLMSRAGTGEIYVSAAALGRSRVGFATTPLEPFHVKGKRQPVRAHCLGTTVVGRPSRVAAGRGEVPPLTGREREIATLTGLLDAAARGTGSCVELNGPPGIGKSRLIDEIRRFADGWTILATGCDEYRAGTPYAPLRDLTRQCLGVNPQAAPADVGRLLTERTGHALPELVPWLPLLGIVAGADVEPTPAVEHLDERFRRARLETTFTTFLRSLLTEPTLLVIDESHLMDEASSSLLRHLLTGVSTVPWFVMLARRPDAPAPSFASDGLATSIEIEPLSSDAVTRLAHAITDEHPLAPHERAAVAARSSGNPLFLLELLSASRTASLDGLPDTVEGVFTAQIDQLDPADRRLLRAASVLGVEVPLAPLRAMVDEAVTSTRLHRLHAFLVMEGVEKLRFRHGLLRDAAYEGLPYAQRRKLHATAGEALRRFAGGDGSEIAPLLAVHFENAGDAPSAWNYARVGGRQAAAIYAHVDAAELYQRALRAARAVSDIAPDELRHTAEALGDARTHLGEFEGAEAAYRQGQGWARSGVDRARLGYKIALAADRRGDYRRCLQRLTTAEHLLGADSGAAAARLRAEIRAQYGLVRHRQGRGSAAVRLLREAVRLARRTEAPDVLATALLYLDIAELTLGLPSDGEHVREAVAVLAAQGGMPWLEARALNQLGIRAYFAGRWAEAVRYYTESRAACERAGDQWTAAVESANIAEVLSDQGHLVEAEAALNEALHSYRAAGTRVFVADGTRLLGRLAARQGNLARAEELLAAARATYAEDGEALQVAHADALLAEARLLAGDSEAALHRALEALDSAATLPGRGLVNPLLHRVIGMARVRLGDAEGGRSDLETSIEEARQRDAAYELALSIRALCDLSPHPLPEAEREAAELFDQLGLVSTASVARVVIPEPRVDLTVFDAGAAVPAGHGPGAR